MKTLIASTLVTLLATSAMAAATIPAGNYAVDNAHSKVGFEIPHLVISTVEGRFDKFEGTIVIDSKIEKSKVDVSIDASSIDTANKDRDDHLRSPDFFDTAKFAKITFVSKKITGTADALKVTGDLTIKGKTKSVVLDTKYLGQVKDAYGNDKVAFNASTKINRKDFGLTWGKAVEAGPVVGDEVTLTLKIQAAKAVEKK